jgi:hypothetical protein
METVLPEQVFVRAKAIGEGHTPGTVELIAFDPGGKMPGPSRFAKQTSEGWLKRAA